MGLTINNNYIITTLDELTIAKFKELLSINLNQDLDFIDKQIKTIEALSDGVMTSDIIEDLDIEVFNSINNSLSLEPNNSTIKEFISIDDNLFSLKGSKDGFAFKLKDILKIRETIQSDFANYITNMMSLIYVNDNFSPKDAAKLFNEYMTMDYVSPFLLILEKTYGNKKG
jgi:hypothetical protein